MKQKKPKTHMVLRSEPVEKWREYCQENGIDPNRHLENIMYKLAIGESVVNNIHHVGANTRSAKND